MNAFRLCTLLALLALALTPAVTAHAQAVMSGIVRDDSTGTPLANVEVLLNGTNFSTRTNAQGRYLLTGLPPGTRQAIFRLLGHLPHRVDVLLTPGDTTRANATLIRSDVVLDPIIVTGDVPTRGVGTGREAITDRQRLGFGKLIDTEMLRRVDGTLQLDDVLRRESGVEIQRTQVDGIWMNVAYNRNRRDVEGKLNCVMSIYYNGALVAPGGQVGGGAQSGALRQMEIRTFALSGLDAVEVYRSAAEVPTEFGGASSACGVILLWSRVAP